MINIYDENNFRIVFIDVLPDGWVRIQTNLKFKVNRSGSDFDIKLKDLKIRV